MTQLEKTMQIQADDHTSQMLRVDGHPVILRFSSEYVPDIYDKIRSILLSSFTMDNSRAVCDNTPGQESNCTLTIKNKTWEAPLVEQESEDSHD